MLSLLKTLFGLFQAVAKLFADKQLIKAGEARQRDADIKELQARVEKAEDAVTVVDDDRTERLRSRFDRSRRGE